MNVAGRLLLFMVGVALASSMLWPEDWLRSFLFALGITWALAAWKGDAGWRS